MTFGKLTITVTYEGKLTDAQAEEVLPEYERFIAHVEAFAKIQANELLPDFTVKFD